MDGQSELAIQMAALRAENDKLIQTLTKLQGSSSSANTRPTVNVDSSNVANLIDGPPAPKRSFGEMKIWVGSWNMGAVDPFQALDLTSVEGKETSAKLLASFIPLGYDVYVLGLQEGVCEAMYDAVAIYTDTYRLPLNGKVYPARDNGKVRSRRMGRAIKVSDFIEDSREGRNPDPVVSTADMLDRVWGRGDGAMLVPKFTGISVYVAPIVAPYVRLLGMYKHSFGASEGSKGGVGVALGLYDVTMAFINVHMASKRPEMRRQQYQELVDRLGSKLGGRGFGLNESFHHIIWMGDLNTHCAGISAADAVALIRSGRHMQLLLQHDELLLEKDNETAFYEYEEPLMGPRFFPTYKKLPGRGKVDTTDPDWVSKVYVTAYKEPFYKGGRVMERVPAWTDRIQYHSLPDRWGELMPEALDPLHPDTSIHNYHAVNDAFDTSDHSAIYATFGLQICAEEMDESVEAYVEAAQAQVGYRQAENGDEDDEKPLAEDGSALPRQLPPVGPITDVPDMTLLHPSLRPLQIDLSLYGIVVDYKGGMVAPRAVSTVFPLPYEDSNEIPDRRKVVRENGIPFFSRGQDSLSIGMRTIVSRANRLETLHLLLKVSLDDHIKAQCVICLKDGGFVGAGTHINTFLQPLICNGLPLKHNGKPVTVTFTMEMNAYERGGMQAINTPSAPVTKSTHASTGLKRSTSPDVNTVPDTAINVTSSTPANNNLRTPGPSNTNTSINVSTASTPVRNTNIAPRPPATTNTNATSTGLANRTTTNSSLATPSTNAAPSPAVNSAATKERTLQLMAAARAKAAPTSTARPPTTGRPNVRPTNSGANSVTGPDNYDE